MTNMQNLQAELDERMRRDEVHAEAVQSMNAKKNRDAARGHAVMATAMSFGDASLGEGRLAKAVHLSKLICIGFTCAAPVLLFARVVF